MWTFIHMGPGNCQAIQSNFRWAYPHFPIQSRDKFHIWKEINQMGEEASRSCFTFEWSSDHVDWKETCWRNQREGGWPKLNFWNATDFFQYWIQGLVMTLLWSIFIINSVENQMIKIQLARLSLLSITIITSFKANACYIKKRHFRSTQGMHLI